MNLGDESDSPWSDQRSNSPHKRPSEDQEPDASDSKAPAATTESRTQSPPSTVTPTVKSPGGRASRTPRRHGTQPTRLETVDASLDPLGPLGSGTIAHPEGEADVKPELPRKEQAPTNSRPPADVGQSSRARSGLGPNQGDDYESSSSSSRNAGIVQSPPHESTPRPSQPSVGVEQAARPTFHITVGDPHKVGDLTSSHTVYQVRTQTTSKAYRQPEFEASRRYRDFLWLYNQLHSNNPGVVVPPPPEKQITGRFDTDFVEQRRAALERMLNKTAAHPVLQHDGDLKLFLESESFNVDIKHREKKDSDIPESKGMFSSLNLSVGSGTKFIEHDDWFLDRRVYLDSLETQLKGLLKATEMAVAQRRALSEASSDLSTSLNTLAQVELSPALTGPLASLSDLHIRIRDLYARQAQQDVLTLSTTIDEYIRLIGSIKKAFDQRQRSWQVWHNAESDLAKRRSALDKLARQGRSQQDRISQLQADVADAERRSHQARLSFEDLGKGMRAELERFEKEKVEDFRMGVETYLESAVEAQKELIELWETYLMHFDADDDEEEAAEAAATAATAAAAAGDPNAPASAADPAPPPGLKAVAERTGPKQHGNDRQKYPDEQQYQTLQSSGLDGEGRPPLQEQDPAPLGDDEDDGRFASPGGISAAAASAASEQAAASASSASGGAATAAGQ